METQSRPASASALQPGKFEHPFRTAEGEARARVDLQGVRTLWFNTGTRCNIECPHCYIRSSPSNDALVYLDRVEVEAYLAELRTRGWPTTEIGFTGGEPFMNPHILGMLEASLAAGFDVLVLTNAMQPMMRPRLRTGLLALHRVHGHRLRLRVSVDHYSEALHDGERGAGSLARTLVGMRWLAEHGFQISVAGRSMWAESEAAARAGFARLFAREGFPIDAHDPAACVIFPEMDEAADVPEITESCWDRLGKRPAEIMCATSRMVIKRRGAARPTVVSCTLITEDPAFEFGSSLREAEAGVQLNHPHCARFCVLGGANCSAGEGGCGEGRSG